MTSTRKEYFHEKIIPKKLRQLNRGRSVCRLQRIKNLSGETIKLHQYQFNVFHRFLDDETFLISDVTLATVNGFILELRSDKHVCNDVTVNTYLRGLRAFLYYCMEMDYMADFKIRIPKVDKKLKETYTDSELNVL